MSDNVSGIQSRSINANGFNIHYLTAGEGEPVLLLHGWPTSSYLWRNIIEQLAKNRKVIVPDLLGFGESDKPIDVKYTFNQHVDIIDAFLNALGVNRTDIVIHDLGGPVGLLWAVMYPDKVNKLIIMNTFLYPELSFVIKLFLLLAKTPVLRNFLVSSTGIALCMRLGIARKEARTKEMYKAYQAPFVRANDRKVLLKNFTDPMIEELKGAADKLISSDIKVHIVVGEKDTLLAGDIALIRMNMPSVPFITVPDAGHFLQEDQPGKVSDILLKLL